MPRPILAGLLLATISWAASAETMPHKAPGLNGIGSAKPIPAKHVACMRIVDGTLDEIVEELGAYGPLPPNRDRYKPEGYARAQKIQVDTTAKMIAIHERLRGYDWGVPPRALAIERLSKFKGEVKRLEEELSQEKANSASDPKAARSDVFAEINRRKENGIRFQLKGYRSLVRYAQCVVANDLPPTTDQIPE